MSLLIVVDIEASISEHEKRAFIESLESIKVYKDIVSIERVDFRRRELGCS